MKQLLQNIISEVKQKYEYVLCGISGTTGGSIASTVYDDYVKPLIVAAMCAIISLLIAHFGKLWLNGGKRKKR